MSKIKNCKSCAKEIAKNAKVCPNCGAKNEVPFYKTVWFWVVVVIVVAILAGGTNDETTSEEKNIEKNKEIKVTVVDMSKMTEAERDTWCSEKKVNCVVKTEYSDTIAKDTFISQSIAADKEIYEGDKITIVISLGKQPTKGEENALKKAESYLSFSAFSKKSLKEQLDYEGFTTKEIEYAIDNVKVSWNEQAAKKAESYLSYSSFSRKRLIEQLEYEGFTHDQAVYGVTQAGL